MSILDSIFTDDLAIDLGTVNTLVFTPERGVVLNEPSAVAIHKYTGEVLWVGAEAYKMLGREPKDIEVFRPIRGGTMELLVFHSSLITHHSSFRAVRLSPLAGKFCAVFVWKRNAVRYARVLNWRE